MHECHLLDDNDNYNYNCTNGVFFIDFSSSHLPQEHGSWRMTRGRLIDQQYPTRSPRGTRPVRYHHIE